MLDEILNTLRIDFPELRRQGKRALKLIALILEPGEELIKDMVDWETKRGDSGTYGPTWSLKVYGRYAIIRIILANEPS